MEKKLAGLLALLLALFGPPERGYAEPVFRTSDRCLACHNGLTTLSGRDVSIGTEWRSSIMANSSRDPYWQAGVRRETIDHPTEARDIEDECSVCHMPVPRQQAKAHGQPGEVFAYLPFVEHLSDSAAAADGVTCSVCHQIQKQNLSTRASFNGGFTVESRAEQKARAEYGPFVIDAGRQHIMETSTAGFQPTAAQHIRDSALCATCHQLYTTARGKGGKAIGSLPEQMPYLEWLHSDYADGMSCQQCHMPEVKEAVSISSVLGVLREGLHQHLFVGANFAMASLLNRYRTELDVAALPLELTSTTDQTLSLLHASAASLELKSVEVVSSRLEAEVVVGNLTGHKLPTAYPSRRAWLHFVVRDRADKTVFESGRLNSDGSIQGNDNDADPSRFEPHYREITRGEQVQIYESILRDSEGRVTTGLLAAVGFLKDNRLLPSGFDKATAEKDIAVVGDAAQDPDFLGGLDHVRYAVPINAADGPFHVKVELWYQPIGFRWAHNLDRYDAAETRRFVGFYTSMSESTGTVLADAQATR